MKIMNLKTTALFFAGLVTLTVSCTKQLGDIYNPNYLQEQAKATFPVKNVDPTHTWAMMSTRTASVKVGGENGSSYLLKVYSENPVFNTTAPLMAKVAAIGGETTSLSFDAPAALERVFVSREGSNGRYVAVAKLIDGKFLGTFEGASLARSLSRSTSLPSGTPFPLVGNKVFVPAHSELVNLFPATAPSDALIAPTSIDNNTPGTKFVLSGGRYSVNFWSDVKGQVEFYVAENASVSFSQFYVDSKLVFHILPGGKLTINDGLYSRKPLILTVDENANLIMTGDSKFIGNNSLKVYNRGVISGSSLKLDQYAELYNYGILSFSESITSRSGGPSAILYNAGALNTKNIFIGGESGYYVNDGTINDASVVIDRGAFENHGTIKLTKLQLDNKGSFNNTDRGVVTVRGETNATQNTCYWINSGHYTTHSVSITSGNNLFYNYCKLFVEDVLDFSDNTFHLMDDAYVKCNTLILHNTRVELGAQSVLNVVAKTTVKYNNGTTHGLFGIGGEDALIKLGGETIRKSDDKHMLHFSGNLVYAAEKMFENGNWTDNVYAENGAEGVDYDQVHLPVPSKEQCAPDWSIGSDGGGSEDLPYLFTYGFEDMTVEVGDYDFNDVVLQVSSPIDGKMKVRLLAAGALKNLHIGFKNLLTGADESFFEGKEVHELLGVAPGTITNTITTNGTPYEKTIEVGANFRVGTHGDFYIVDSKGSQIHIAEFTPGYKAGDVPYAVRIPKDWDYPREKVSITEAYLEFENWAQDATASTNWYDRSVLGNVFLRTE
ncbi:MAG: LruC domain-containing protein [Phocaeicola sp.]